MQHLKRIHVDSCPDVHLLIFNLQFGLIDCGRLPPVAVGFKQVFEAMVLVVNRHVTHLNERFDPPER